MDTRLSPAARGASMLKPRGDRQAFCQACDRAVPVTQTGPMLTSGVRRVGWHCVACGNLITSERVHQKPAWWWFALPVVASGFLIAWLAGWLS